MWTNGQARSGSEPVTKIYTAKELRVTWTPAYVQQRRLLFPHLSFSRQSSITPYSNNGGRVALDIANAKTASPRPLSSLVIEVWSWFAFGSALCVLLDHLMIWPLAFSGSHLRLFSFYLPYRASLAKFGQKKKKEMGQIWIFACKSQICPRIQIFFLQFHCQKKSGTTFSVKWQQYANEVTKKPFFSRIAFFLHFFFTNLKKHKHRK